jgi:hypothetical protein
VDGIRHLVQQKDYKEAKNDMRRPRSEHTANAEAQLISRSGVKNEEHSKMTSKQSSVHINETFQENSSTVGGKKFKSQQCNHHPQTNSTVLCRAAQTPHTHASLVGSVNQNPFMVADRRVTAQDVTPKKTKHDTPGMICVSRYFGGANI